jgi:hypothetical protein
MGPPERGPGKAGPISNVVCPGCRRSLDDVIESLIRQRGKFKGQREKAKAERDEARAKNARLREVLEALWREHHATVPHHHLTAAERRAWAILDG